MAPLLLSLSQSHSLEKHWSIIDLVSIKLLKSQLSVIKVTGASTGNCFGSLLVVSYQTKQKIKLIHFDFSKIKSFSRNHSVQKQLHLKSKKIQILDLKCSWDRSTQINKFFAFWHGCWFLLWLIEYVDSHHVKPVSSLYGYVDRCGALECMNWGSLTA